MTRLTDALSRMPTGQRVLIGFGLAIAAIFLLGMSVGVISAMATKGWPSKSWVAFVPLAGIPSSFFALFLTWRAWVPPASASGYERRYWKGWMMIVAMSIVVGVASGVAMLSAGSAKAKILSLSPLPPGLALFLAIAFSIGTLIAIALYHRAVDDHEERAYLWGSQVAYYFLLIALPVWWLLQRGGMVAPLGIGNASIAILISILIQAAVWAWLKFR